jgi:Ca2+/Na+ antiporter
MKTKDILLRQGLAGIVFVLWGILWLALYYENTFGKALSGFFIILGIFISIKSYSKWKKWKDSDIHTDETITDERSELNTLRASRAGFIFLYISVGVLGTLLGLRLINEIIFTALMGPVFAVASVLYVLLFYRYDKGVNENEN